MPHSYTALYTHVVFSTKDRRPQITTSLEERLYPYLGGILRDLNGRLLHVNGADDHTHILISSPPTASLAELVGKVKGCSSKWVNDTFPQRAKFAWQRGYAAFSVSQSQIPVVARYIERQKAHHAKTSFQDEFVRLLKRHGIQVDERFLWT
jgi:REP element-mobilizing transposase RayT